MMTGCASTCKAALRRINTAISQRLPSDTGAADSPRRRFRSRRTAALPHTPAQMPSKPPKRYGRGQSANLPYALATLANSEFT
jgi:hypothetical protein